MSPPEQESLVGKRVRLIKIDIPGPWRNRYVGTIGVVKEHRVGFGPLPYLVNFGEEAIWCKTGEIEVVEDE